MAGLIAAKKLGEVLLEEGLITNEQLQQALQVQANSGSRLGDVILALGLVRPLDFYQALSRHFGLDFVNLMQNPVDASLVRIEELDRYAQHLYLPWRRHHNVLQIATADPTGPDLPSRAETGEAVQLVVASKFEILWELQRIGGERFGHDAVYHLAEFDPARSASVVMTAAQKRIGLLLLLAVIAASLVFPLKMAIGFNILFTVFLLVSFCFRMILCWMSCSDACELFVTGEDVSKLRDEELPVYTILVPMYREPEVLPVLVSALKTLDYPRSKLDIKLVLEADDAETIDAAKALGLASTFEIVRVPPSLPKTKPKACNYALRLARGHYLTIYDAEDRPEPDQLKKVIAAFRKMGPGTACVQARLNYFNAEENWLTRMFTLEYSLWFEMFLPALDRLRMPIPLGGTSNHFDLAKLREAGAWDPFNVTEDADLGLRFAALGYHVAVVNSVTYEEANMRVGNWIRQRSRWIKGFIQTWLVNMRHPVQLRRSVGWRGFWSLQLFVGGGIFSALIYPFMTAQFLLWLLARSPGIRPLFPDLVLIMATFNMVVGNSCLIYLSMLAAAKRHHFKLLPYALTVPAYWTLMSIAGYKGLWQLIRKPFYWEKTTHGISRFSSSETVPPLSDAA